MKKTHIAILLGLLTGLITTSGAEDLDILLSRSGELSWNDTRSNGVYKIEYASRLDNATTWERTWPDQQYINASGGVISVDVPMYFRVEYIAFESWLNNWTLTACADGTNMFDPVVKWEAGEWDPEEHENAPVYEGTDMRTGILELHPIGTEEPAILQFNDTNILSCSTVEVTACGNVAGDALLQCAVNESVIDSRIINGSAWTTCVFDVSAYFGQSVKLEIRNAAGGDAAWFFEHAFIDSIVLE